MTRCAFEAGTNFLKRFIIVLSVKFQSTLKNIAIENLRWRFQMTGSPKQKEMVQVSHLEALESDFPGNMINHRQKEFLILIFRSFSVNVLVMLLNKSSILCLAEASLVPVSQLNQRKVHNADTFSSVSLSVSPG